MVHLGLMIELLLFERFGQNSLCDKRIPPITGVSLQLNRSSLQSLSSSLRHVLTFGIFFSQKKMYYSSLSKYCQRNVPNTKLMLLLSS